MKEYLDPYCYNIGLNPDSMQKVWAGKRTHVQPDEKGLTTARHMNNNKLSRDKEGIQNIYCHVNWVSVLKLHFENVYVSHQYMSCCTWTKRNLRGEKKPSHSLTELILLLQWASCQARFEFYIICHFHFYTKEKITCDRKQYNSNFPRLFMRALMV